MNLNAKGFQGETPVLLILQQKDRMVLYIYSGNMIIKFDFYAQIKLSVVCLWYLSTGVGMQAE